MTSEQRITRRQVAERFGISTSSVRRLEGVRLHPTLDDEGVWRFDPAEFESFSVQKRERARRFRSRKQPGDVAAQVFRMLERRCSLREIVVIARQPPELVRRLYLEWLTGLAEGERTRAAHDAHERQRRELVEDERMHMEHMKALDLNMPGEVE
jgi:hypothetical protein